ncbi:TPA: hypothetical protein N0F65_004536 [Lagenidium giganteum]|uniref:Phosphoribosyltransferase domain-containing protein n=1 Tax=Lagenidium giganteum TaxID=4803 RepID=A0AAV2YXL9_9STRA|nr:TPA: hypothetical protein N0F65_004536 [Lagenidium giganteum]
MRRRRTTNSEMSGEGTLTTPPAMGSLVDLLNNDQAHIEPAEENIGRKRKLSNVEYSPTSSCGSVGEQKNEAKSSATAAGTTKKSRYLREADRRSIIHRIEMGEKQATLAKEFGVTRAAICHINKNRVEILTRSVRADVHSAARHPKRGLYNTSKVTPRQSGIVEGYGDLPIVYEVRSQAMAILLTALRRKDTKGRDFRHFADRAFRLLLEESLASASTRQVEIMAPGGTVCSGVVSEMPACAIAISEGGFAMLDAFRALQPDAATGFMTLDRGDVIAHRKMEMVLRKMSVPANIRTQSVFVVDSTSTTGSRACAAIRALIDGGVPEDSIYYVCLLTSALGVSEFCNQFPKARIITAAIDPDVNDSQGISPGVGNFLERYYSTVLVQHSMRGANADL